ncbi:MAG TPA: glycosyltransferase, partial [Patescibacteria group bacterium]|nr:glycosyltransferase [Patescibacteria group bacterium]
MAKLEGTLDIRETRETLKEPKSLCVVSSTSFPRWEEGHSNADLLGEVVRFNSSRKGHLNELQEENRLSDIIRGNLAIESVRNLSFLGIDVVLVDSHSSEQFLAKIKKIAKPEKGHLDIFPQTEKGYGEARRKALLEAPISLNSKYPGTVIMAEIEKKDLFLERNLVDLVTPIREGDADVVIPNRGFIIHDSVLDHPERWDEEFPGEFHAGYPPYQARSETWLNRELARTMTKCGFTVRGRWLDYLNGTRVFRADVTLLSQMMNVYKAEGKQVKHVDTDTYFSSVYAMFLNLGAIGKSGRIVEVPIRFTYPKA